MIQTTEKDLMVPCSASSTWVVVACALMGSSDFRGHQIDQGEYEHPDQVDEVPVEAGHLDVFVLELAAGDGDRNDREIDHADGHVCHMQARDAEEGRAEQRHAPFV